MIEGLLILVKLKEEDKELCVTYVVEYTFFLFLSTARYKSLYLYLKIMIIGKYFIYTFYDVHENSA